MMAALSAVLLCACTASLGFDRGATPGDVAGNADLRVVAGHFESGPMSLGSGPVGEVFSSGGERLRIDAARADPGDATGEIVLYRFSRLDRGGTSYCPGDGLGFPMIGSWATGAHERAPGQVSIACLGTPEARCVQLGYRPWRHAANGADLWDYHQACVRALRADYCGTGLNRGVAGERIALYDRLGIQPLRGADGMSFEAAWSADGAACVNHIRAPSRMSLKDLRTECANLPKAHLGNSCDEREPALIFTKSPPR